MSGHRARRLAAVFGAFGLVLTAGTFDVPKAASVVSAAPAVAPDPTTIPHYFGPYPNWANSPITRGDATA